MYWIKDLKAIEVKKPSDVNEINELFKEGWSIVTSYTPTEETVVFILGHKESGNVRASNQASDIKEKGIQICPKCQRGNQSHYNFCAKCGQQLKQNPVILRW